MGKNKLILGLALWKIGLPWSASPRRCSPLGSRTVPTQWSPPVLPWRLGLFTQALSTMVLFANDRVAKPVMLRILRRHRVLIHRLDLRTLWLFMIWTSFLLVTFKDLGSFENIPSGIPKTWKSPHGSGYDPYVIFIQSPVGLKSGWIGNTSASKVFHGESSLTHWPVAKSISNFDQDFWSESNFDRTSIQSWSDLWSNFRQNMI